LKVVIEPENLKYDKDENVIEFVLDPKDLMEIWEKLLTEKQIHFVLKFKCENLTPYVTRQSNVDDSTIWHGAFIDIHFKRGHHPLFPEIAESNL